VVNTSGGKVSTWPYAITVAVWMTASNAPKASTAASTARWTSASRRVSPAHTSTAAAPASRHCAATDSSTASERDISTS
jgi:hypothetical protein